MSNDIMDLSELYDEDSEVSEASAEGNKKSVTIRNIKREMYCSICGSRLHSKDTSIASFTFYEPLSLTSSHFMSFFCNLRHILCLYCRRTTKKPGPGKSDPEPDPLSCIFHSV